ncbi:MAG: NHL repeat-containing protein [Pseudomonadota bacterium]
MLSIPFILQRLLAWVAAGLLSLLMAACSFSSCTDANNEMCQVPGQSSSLSGLSLIAGGIGGSGSVDATGTNARLASPSGITADSSGNLYVSDRGNQTIRKITPAGVVTTLAGMAGNAGSSDGTGSAARFQNPYGVAADGAGNLYVADMGNHTIRKIVIATGDVTTFAGMAGNFGSNDGTGGAALFDLPRGITFDGAANLYVADRGNHTIRKIVIATGEVTTFAGTAGNPGSSDGTGGAAEFQLPSGITADGAGNLYVADTNNHAIRKIVIATADVTTLAGTAGSAGSTDGTGGTARFDVPMSVTAGGDGALYVADTSNHSIRKITPAGEVITIAGMASNAGSSDGTGGAAQFRNPFGLAADSAGNIYVADSPNHTIRQITPAGVVTTLAGLVGTIGANDGTGGGARFQHPRGITADGSGNLYVADTYNHTIRKIVIATGDVSTLAGMAGNIGSSDGTAGAAQFRYPHGITFDGAGALYVVDTDNGTIRKIVIATAEVSTLAGTAGNVGSNDGAGVAAEFQAPIAITADGAGNLYVADTFNHTIRKIVISSGDVTTLAGMAGNIGSSDGTGGAAQFRNPFGLAADGTGNLYAADTNNHTIRKIVAATGEVTTIAGVAGRIGILLGDLPGNLDLPVGVTLIDSTTLAITTGNAVIRIVLP